MNADQMLDLALGQLDSPTRERAERELADDPRQAQLVAALNRSLQQLLDDESEIPIPPGLAARTSAFVMTHRERKRNIYDFVPASVPLRWTDMAVAAGILLAGLLTLIPAFSRSREQSAQAGCAYNLQQLGKALLTYGNRHAHFPFGPEQSPEAHAGSYLALLNDEKLLPDLKALECPSNNGTCPDHPPVPHFRELISLQKVDPERYQRTLHSDYAYNISFRHRSGRVEPIEVQISALPLLADQPGHLEFVRILPGNSPNHSGRGQNVLYTDMHVGFHTSRWVGPRHDDLFLNDNGELSPGLHEQDSVLVPSLAPFTGAGRAVPASIR